MKSETEFKNLKINEKISFIILYIVFFVSIYLLFFVNYIFSLEYIIINATPIIDFFNNDNYKIAVISGPIIYFFYILINKKENIKELTTILLMLFIHGLYSYFISYKNQSNIEFFNLILYSFLLFSLFTAIFQYSLKRFFLLSVFYFFYILILSIVNVIDLKMSLFASFFSFYICISLIKPKSFIDFIRLYLFSMFSFTFISFIDKPEVNLILSFCWIIILALTETSFCFFMQKNQFKHYIALRKIKIFFAAPYIKDIPNLKFYLCHPFNNDSFYDRNIWFQCFCVFFMNIIQFSVFFILYKNDYIEHSYYFFIFFIYSFFEQFIFIKEIRHSKTQNAEVIIKDIINQPNKLSILNLVILAFFLVSFSPFNDSYQSFLFFLKMFSFFILIYCNSVFLIVLFIFSIFNFEFKKETPNQETNSFFIINAIDSFSFFVNESNFEEIEEIQIKIINKIKFTEDDILYLYKVFEFPYKNSLVISDHLLYSFINKYRILNHIKTKEKLNINDDFEWLVKPYEKAINNNENMSKYLNFNS